MAEKKMRHFVYIPSVVERKACTARLVGPDLISFAIRFSTQKKFGHHNAGDERDSCIPTHPHDFTYY